MLREKTLETITTSIESYEKTINMGTAVKWNLDLTYVPKDADFSQLSLDQLKSIHLEVNDIFHF